MNSNGEKSSGFKNARDRMISEQIVSRNIKDDLVLAAIKAVPRERFVPAEYTGCAYEDRPLPIGMGQTISQPYIVALMTESLELSSDMKVMEIGTGSGYQSAVLAEIAKEVYSVEINSELYNRTKKILASYPNIRLSNHDGSVGWEENSPYDRIIVTAAPLSIPEVYYSQLKDGGIMVIPVGPSSWNQELYKITKTAGRIKRVKLCDVAFVPLTGKCTG
ncbi:MAG: protein-L-isoaspartate(D-aspartate) O-methyltransferase [Actinobacteria bacterium]|nr:protein-L-isoaspartate(D-aspartate) O-methyltransferase [Actinomycetota bacterium]